MNNIRLLFVLAVLLSTFAASCAFSGAGDFEDLDGILSVQQDESESQGAADALPEGPVEVGVQEAVLTALEHNRSLRLERMVPKIRRTSEEIQEAAFDTELSASVSGSRRRTKDDTSDSRSYSTGGGIELSRTTPSGTRLSAGLSTSRSWSDLYSDSHATGIDLTVTQSLLQGRGAYVNLASLRQARIDTEISEYELRGYAESLAAEIETTYWDYALATRQIEIYTDSLQLAEQYLSETTERIKVGKLAESELAAAQAQVALRKEDLINARGNLAKLRLSMLRLLNPPGANLWDREVILKDKPAVPDVKLDRVEAHVEVAMRLRPDLNQARLRLKRGELEVVKTKNGLLPRLDLFITLGKTGYAESFHGSMVEFNRGSYNYSAGLTLEYPLGNRAARARHKQAMLSREQAEESLRNLEQLAQVDVRSAYIEVNRAKEQVAATAATRKLQEETLRSETEKFRVGKSTTYLVAQAQRDLVAAKVSEIQAVVNYIKSLATLFRLEGSLLERRGVSAPGQVPAAARQDTVKPDSEPENESNTDE